MASDGCNFSFHFGLFFVLLPSITAPKMKISKKKKKRKKHLEILSFCTSVQKIMIICYIDKVINSTSYADI